MARYDLGPDKTDALIEKVGGPFGAEKLLSGEWVVGTAAQVTPALPETGGALLAPVSPPVQVPAIDRFTACEHFLVDREGELPISYIGEDFEEHFLDLIEENAGSVSLVPRMLMRGTIDAPIFETLGGENGARVSLAHLFGFLKYADRTRWYFFYVADTAGKLWAVDTYWRDRGWDMEAYSVTYPRGWRRGGCVVSAA